MEENVTKLNNTDRLPPEGHQVSDLAKDNEVNQDLFASGAEDEYYSFDDELCGDSCDTQSELDGDFVVTETMENVIDPISNGGHILKIWSHRQLNFINETTITS